MKTNTLNIKLTLGQANPAFKNFTLLNVNNKAAPLHKLNYGNNFSHSLDFIRPFSSSRVLNMEDLNDKNDFDSDDFNYSETSSHLDLSNKRRILEVDIDKNAEETITAQRNHKQACSNYADKAIAMSTNNCNEEEKKTLLSSTNHLKSYATSRNRIYDSGESDSEFSISSNSVNLNYENSITRQTQESTKNASLNGDMIKKIIESSTSIDKSGRDVRELNSLYYAVQTTKNILKDKTNERTLGIDMLSDVLPKLDNKYKWESESESKANSSSNSNFSSGTSSSEANLLPSFQADQSSKPDLENSKEPASKISEHKRKRDDIDEELSSTNKRTLIQEWWAKCTASGSKPGSDSKTNSIIDDYADTSTELPDYTGGDD